MTDIALVPDRWGNLDIDLVDGDIETEDGLRTAVALSLLTDARARADDELPFGDRDRRGWWADAWAPEDGDRFGSRLWLLFREKDMPEVRRRAEAYAREALQWVIDDGIAEDVQVEAETSARGVLALHVTISRGDGRQLAERYDYVWDR